MFVTHHTAEDKRLEDLPGAKLAGVERDPQKVCLPGTREEFLDEIMT